MFAKNFNASIMKKELIAAIKAKFVGIDDNTAKRLAERAIAKSESPITTEDEVNVAVEAITLADVLKSVNDFSADDAVKRYEAKYGLENGEKKVTPGPKPTEPKPAEPKPTEPKPSEPKPEDTFKALLNEFKTAMTTEFNAIKGDLAAMKTGKISETRRARLETLLKDLKDFQKKPYARIDLSKMSDEEFESFCTDVKEEVNDILAENRASTSNITPPIGGKRHEQSGPTKEATKDEMDALMDKFNLPKS